MVVRRAAGAGAPGHLIPHLASETTTERARAAPNRNEKGGRERDRQKCRGTCDHRLTPADQGTNADDASRALAKIPATTHLTMHKREGRDSDSQGRIFSLARLFLRRVRKINDVLGLTSPFLSGLTKQLPLTRDFVKKDGGREEKGVDVRLEQGIFCQAK